MTPSLYIATESYMVYEDDTLFLKFLVPQKLTTINKILTQDNGYIVLDTNYGEEYVDLKTIKDEIALDAPIHVPDLLKNAYVIVDGIAFEYIHITNRIIATDLNHPSYKASFAIRGLNLVLSVSTFSDTRESTLMGIVANHGTISHKNMSIIRQFIKDNISSIKHTWTDFAGYVEFLER